MSIVLQSTGGGSVSIVEPTTASNFTQTLPASAGVVMVSGNMPAFSAYGSAGQSIANNTWTKIAFNTELFDTNNNYDSTTNFRFTPTVTGYYQFSSCVFTSANATGLMFTNFYKNGSIFYSGNVVPNSNGGYINSSALIFLNGSTDYVEFYVLQTSGISLSIGSNATQFQFSGAMVRTA